LEQNPVPVEEEKYFMQHHCIIG